jgi:putative DNA primase/helicase
MLKSSPSIHAFMTDAMKADLIACGFTEAQLAELTPQEGDEILAAANNVASNSDELRKMIEIIVAQARRSTEHLKEPGLLQVSRIHPLDEAIVCYRHTLNDPKLIERITHEALEDNKAGHNVFIEGRTVRRGLKGKERGKVEDTIAVFASVVDSDADKGETWTPNVPVSLSVSTSPGNEHSWLFWERALDPATGKAFGDRLRSATKTDKPTGTITQPYRLAGSINIPTDKKRNRGRVEVLARILNYDPKVLWKPEQFEKVFPETNGVGDPGENPEAPIERIAAALAVIPHNDNDPHSVDYWKEIGHMPGRSYMVQIGLAVKAASGGSAEGFELFDKWRQGAPDYNVDMTKKKWDGFHPTKIGFGTLKFYADKAKPGWDKNAIDAEVERLAKLSDANYDRERKVVAGKLGLRVGTLDKLRTKARKAQAQAQAPTAVPIGRGGLEDDVALAFSAKYATDARYVHKWGTWLFWTGVRWRPEETLIAFHFARELCRVAENAEHKTVAAVVGLARTDRRQAAVTSQWDANPWLLGTPKGTIDLRTGKLSAAKAEDYITKITSVAPADKVDCPLWLKFLNRVMAGNQEMIDYLQRVCGYCLTGDTTEDALFFHHGKGGNGKTVFLETIAGILNDYHEAADMELFVVTHSEKHPTDLASLRGARLVTAVETEEGKRWAEAKLKQMTGGDPIKARFMRQDFFTYIPQFKLQFGGNYRPAIRNIDIAISRRFHLIPWLVTIPKNEQNKKLSDDLKPEWPGILRWMIDGCLAWQKDGLKPPKAVNNATQEYLDSEDTVQNFFDDCCVIAKNESDTFEHIWDGYVDWCEDCREFIGTKKAFGQKLKDKGFQAKGGKERTYIGIRCVRENRKRLLEDAKQSTERLKAKVEEQRLRQAAKTKSDELPYTSPAVDVPDQETGQLDEHGTPHAAPPRPNGPPLTQGSARDLAQQYLDRAVAEHNTNSTGNVNSKKLDAWLRERLRAEVAAGLIEAAFEQVMKLVFAT